MKFTKNEIVWQGLSPAAKKLLSIMLSIVMLFSITAGIDLSAYAETSNSVKSISYKSDKPLTYVENVVPKDYIDINNGDWWTIDDEGKEYFYYHAPQCIDGVYQGTLTVNYTNGTSVKYTFDEDINNWIDTKGDEISERVYIYDNQRFEHWTVGNNNYMYINYMDKVAEVPITIIENPVKSISYKPVIPFIKYKDSNETWAVKENNSYGFMACSPYYLDGNILTVNYKNGSSVDYIYNADKARYISKDGDFLGDIYSLEYDVEYDYDNNKIEFLNAKTEIPVKLLENPVKSISGELVTVHEKDFLFFEDGINYYDNPCSFEGSPNKCSITINFKDGTSSKFSPVKCIGGGRGSMDYIYRDAKGNEIKVVIDTWVHEDTKLNKTYYILGAMGFEVENPAVIAEKHTHSWDNGKVTKNATCKATGVKTYTCSKCKATKTETIAKTNSHTYKTTTTKATTSKNGSVVTKCTVCGKVSKNTAIAYPKTITLSATSYTYDGKVKKPTVTVKDSACKKIATSNYTVTYANGRKNVGTYKVTIKFKGNYSGTVTKTFTIKPKATTLSSVTAGKKKFTAKWKKQATQTTGY